MAKAMRELHELTSGSHGYAYLTVVDDWRWSCIVGAAIPSNHKRTLAVMASRCIIVPMLRTCNVADCAPTNRRKGPSGARCCLKVQSKLPPRQAPRPTPPLLL